MTVSDGPVMPGGKVLPGLDHQCSVLRLGEDIVRQFAHIGDQDEAASEIATHLKKFWDPRMRRDLLAHVRLGDTRMPVLLGHAAAHLVDGDVNRQELAEPSGG